MKCESRAEFALPPQGLRVICRRLFKMTVRVFTKPSQCVYRSGPGGIHFPRTSAHCGIFHILARTQAPRDAVSCLHLRAARPFVFEATLEHQIIRRSDSSSLKYEIERILRRGRGSRGTSYIPPPSAANFISRLGGSQRVWGETKARQSSAAIPVRPCVGAETVI
jgi:hypothetical protein